MYKYTHNIHIYTHIHIYISISIHVHILIHINLYNPQGLAGGALLLAAAIFNLKNQSDKEVPDAAE